MCKIVEDLMLRDGKLKKEEIANYFDLTLDEVEMLEKEITQTV